MVLVTEAVEDAMAVSEIANAAEDLIKSLALLIEIAHYCAVIIGVRSEWDQKRARKQPVATWLMSMACCFGGGMLTNIAVGKPAMMPFSSNKSVGLMTAIWWLIFYSPKDIIFSLLSWQPTFMVILTLKEMIRTRKVVKGVNLAREIFPGSILICTLVGMLSACGGGFIKNAASILRKQWDESSVETLYFSQITKLTLLFSLCYNLQMQGLVDIAFNNVVFMQFVVMSLVSIDSKFGSNTDLFFPVEKIVTSIVVDYSAFKGTKVEKPKRKRSTKED